MGLQDLGGEIGSERSEEEEEEDADAAVNKDVKVVEWEVFHDAFLHLGGVAVNLSKVKAKKKALSEKLRDAVEIGTVSVQRVNALEAMQRRLMEKRNHLLSANASLKDAREQVVKVRNNLLHPGQSLAQSAKALPRARNRIQAADRLLAGEGGQGRLNHLRKLLDARRRELVGHLASLFPLTTCPSDGSSTNNNAVSAAKSNSPSDGDTSSTSADESPMAIAGLQLLVPVKKQLGLYTVGNEYESSATALGYVAQVVSLVAIYLDVPLRYPVRLGASRSYIQDPCPATEPAMPDTVQSAAKQGVEFPLFSEGQELTRAAYAVFLLNKDLEQILNQYGVESVGPRHTLPNLSRLINTVASGVHPLA